MSRQSKALAMCALALGSLAAGSSYAMTGVVDEAVLRLRTERALHALVDAFHRKYGALDGQGRQPAIASGSWFPAYGFAPASGTLTWQFVGLDADTGALCVAVPAPTPARRSIVVGALQRLAFGAADANCAAQSGWSEGTVVYGRRVLDRRDVPVPTVLPSGAGVRVSGADAEAVTRPGVQLVAANGQTSPSAVLTVTNPMRWVRPDQSGCTAEQAGADATCASVPTSLTIVSARSGFTVAHDCTAVAAGESCAVSVTYTNAGERYRAMPLRLEFSTGEVATVGVLGRRQP